MKRTVKMIRKIFIAVLAFSMVFSIDTVAFAESVGNSYGNNVVSELCKDDEHNYIDTVIPATLTENGIVTSTCSICGNEKITHIYYPQVFNISDAEYTGKVLKPAIIIKDSNGKIIANSNYTVTYSNNINVGIGKVNVIFKNYYSGVKELNFKIKEVKPSISLNKTSVSIEKKGKAILKANVKPVANVKWKTSNSKIATVNKKGVVNGKAVGKAMITASFKYKGKTYKKVCKVNVTKAKSKKLKVSMKIADAPGSEWKTVRVTVKNDGDYPLYIKNPYASMLFYYKTGSKVSVSGYMSEKRYATTKFMEQNREFQDAYGRDKLKLYDYYLWYPYYYNTIKIPAHKSKSFFVELENRVVITKSSQMTTYFTYRDKEYVARFGVNPENTHCLKTEIPQKDVGFDFEKP